MWAWLPALVYVTLETVLFQRTIYHPESLKEHAVHVYKTEKDDVKDVNYCLGIFFFVNSEISLWLARDGY